MRSTKLLREDDVDFGQPHAAGYPAGAEVSAETPHIVLLRIEVDAGDTRAIEVTLSKYEAEQLARALLSVCK